MPKKLHERAKAVCHSLGVKEGGDKWDACVYGYMRKHGWKSKKLLRKKAK